MMIASDKAWRAPGLRAKFMNGHVGVRVGSCVWDPSAMARLSLLIVQPNRAPSPLATIAMCHQACSIGELAGLHTASISPTELGSVNEDSGNCQFQCVANSRAPPPRGAWEFRTQPGRTCVLCYFYPATCGRKGYGSSGIVFAYNPYPAPDQHNRSYVFIALHILQHTAQINTLKFLSRIAK